MPVVFDTGALLRPRFTESEFVATKWNFAADKADFANTLCRFIAADFQENLFTEKLYRRLSNTFGHIAHYDRSGFFHYFFRGERGKVDFLETTLAHPCYGEPGFTFSDVECAVLTRLRAGDLLAAYRARRAAQAEAAERALLAQLRRKYESETAASPTTAPILHPGAMHVKRGEKRTNEQASLF